LRGLLGLFLPCPALLPAASAVAISIGIAITQARGLPDLRILRPQCLERFFCGLGPFGATRGLDFAPHLRHFRGDLLPQRGSVELQQAFNLVFGEVLVVNSNNLFRHLIHVEFLLIAVGESTHERLAFVIVGNRHEQFFLVLLGGIADGILHLIPGPHQLHQRADIGILDGINPRRFRACRLALSRSAFRRGLRGILRRTLNGQKKSSHVNDNKCQDRLHNFLRSGFRLLFRHPLIVRNTAFLRAFRKYRRSSGITVRLFRRSSRCQRGFLLLCRQMAQTEADHSLQPQSDPGAVILEREAGLHRNLTPRQLSMIAIGGAIGTGLFLGSAISVKLAGPGVIFSYIAGAVVALCLMWALGEVTVAHPVAGSFGVHAEIYVHPWAGFAMRYSYWLAQVIAIGSEVVATSIYCKYWFPNVPPLLWIAGFSAALVYVNARSVASFGTFEYWFAMIKVLTITVFLILGAALLMGIGFPRIGTTNYTAQGGFLPNGWRGVGLGVAMAIFSFLGIEVVAVTSGEAKDPATALPRALRWTLGRLCLFYIGGLAVVVGVVPWNQVGLGESPFVRVFETAGIPGAAGVMNFVVLTAALSSINCNLYLTARMLFSLSRGGYAPAALGRLSKEGTPVTALLVSSAGMIGAGILDHWFHETAYVYMLGSAFLGGLFVWQMIFVTHLVFRRRTANLPHPPQRFAPAGPWSSLFGLVALTAVLVSTWWVPGLRITLVAGVPWLAFISLCYFVWARLGRTNPKETR